MFHRTPVLLLHCAPLTRQDSGIGEGLDGGGGWGLREEGGGEGVAQKQQWMVHPLCLQHTV